MIKRIITCIGFLLCSSALAAQTSEKAWNFDADTPGGIPEGFTVVLGDWKIVADADATSRPGVLAQLATNVGSTFNLILASETNSRNVDISVKMKAVAGKEDQGGGLVVEAKKDPRSIPR
jgi:hypothetical protein